MADCLECLSLGKLAIDRFGEKLGNYLLWEQTCYPMSYVTALSQMQHLIAKADRGEKPTLVGWVGSNGVALTEEDMIY